MVMMVMEAEEDPTAKTAVGQTDTLKLKLKVTLTILIVKLKPEARRQSRCMKR
jgi:hypothetical protein